MNVILDKILRLLERQLPDQKGYWISDLRDEAFHISGRVARFIFLWSGLLAALVCALRIKFSPQKLGQMLLGVALLLLCLGGLVIMSTMPDDIVKIAFYCILPLYALAGILAVLDLRLMKRFTLSSSVLLFALWFVFGLGLSEIENAPMNFLRAISLEAAFMMAGLFIAASYLSWMETVDHA